MSKYCNGITKQGRPCRNKALVGRNHCQCHGPFCCGNRRDGGKCGARAQANCNWLYCCPSHDPTRATTSVEEFRLQGNLRSLRGGSVLKAREGKDPYSKQDIRQESNGISLMSKYELDHVFENHIVRDYYDKITPQGINFASRKKELLPLLREIVNEVDNLAYTEKNINRLKFQAIDTFKIDFYNERGKQVEEGLFPYLIDEFCHSQGTTTTGVRRPMPRSVSRNIQKELKVSSDFIIDSLQDEDPLQGQMIEGLHDIVTRMRLN